MHKSPKTAKTDKDKCWKVFSQFIRVAGCLEWTGLPFVGVCYTCGKRFHISALEAGHGFAGRSNAKLLLRKFVRCQCTYCNRIKHGRPKVFKDKLVAEFGEGFVDRAIRRMNKNIHDRDINWTERAARYKRKTEKLLRKHGYRTWREMLEVSR